MSIYTSGIRDNARMVVANLIKEFKGKRTYFGLPHKTWEDFKLVRSTCPNVEHGIGIENKLDVLLEAANNTPDWCSIYHGSVSTYVQGTGRAQKKISAGWFDAMAKVNTPAFNTACRFLPHALDPNFNAIPMAFSYFSGREFRGGVLEDASKIVNEVGWEFSTREERETARLYCMIDALNQVPPWNFEAFEIRQLRPGSPMKLLTGAFYK